MEFTCGGSCLHVDTGRGLHQSGTQDTAISRQTRHVTSHTDNRSIQLPHFALLFGEGVSEGVALLR